MERMVEMTIAVHACSESATQAEPRFHEPWPAWIRRYALGTAYALRPSRIGLLPHLAIATAMHMVNRGRGLPDAPRFYTNRGFIGVCDRLDVATLLERYRRGFFPVCHIGPMKWWCPAERAILFPGNLRIETGVRRLLRGGKFRFTFDRDFAGVMRACAEPRPGKTPLTWITPRVMEAFWRLHEAGYAHSLEVWDDGRLVGGIYGLAVGDVFFIESQFARVANTSKMATAVLQAHLVHWRLAVIDGKWPTAHLGSLGFTTLNREAVQGLLSRHACTRDRVGRWELDPTLDASKLNAASRDSGGKKQSAQPGGGTRIAPAAGELAVEVDRLSPDAWNRLIGEFADASYEQTACLLDDRWGAKRVSHLVVRRKDVVIGGARLLLLKPPLLRGGLAQAKFAPFWRRHDTPADPATYRSVVAALIEEYCARRSCYLSIVPRPHPNYYSAEIAILAELGFTVRHASADENRAMR
jgi:leucyl/phenylalanyl-tRNA--protein transferase